MTENQMKHELSKLSKKELINQMILKNITIEKLSKALDDTEAKLKN